MIVVDCSALLAILFDEPEKRPFEDAIGGAERCLISAVNAHEAATVLRVRNGRAATILRKLICKDVYKSCLGQGYGCAVAPIFPSVPAISRPMFAQCITHSSAASAANSHASRASPNVHSIAGVAALAIRAESEE